MSFEALTETVPRARSYATPKPSTVDQGPCVEPGNLLTTSSLSHSTMASLEPATMSSSTYLA